MSENGTMTVEHLISQYQKLIATAEDAAKRFEEAAAIMGRQNKVIEIAWESMLSVVEDKDCELRIRRKLLWAMQQIQGFTKP